MMTDAVFEKHYPIIYNYVYYRVMHKETAEDITSEVFCKAVAGEKSYNPRHASYSTWLFAIAHNCVVSYYRTKKIEVSLDGYCDVPQDSFLDDNLIKGDESERLNMLLKMLTERERTILGLRFWGEFSYGEIAMQTNLTEKNVGVILSRAIAKLKLLWQH
jgi:RNA polymerase sigma-70 factor (ECF subfamily)